MKKGFYIRHGSKTEFIGVEKKVKDQIGAFSKYYDMVEVVVEKENAGLLEYGKWCLPGGSWGMQYEKALDCIDSYVGRNNEIAFFYIRVCPPDRRFVWFLQIIKKKYPQSKILIEIPTYPYANDLIRSKIMWPWYFKDIANRQSMANVADRIVTFSDNDSLFGKETIRIINGIDVESIPFVEDSRHFEERKPNMISLLAVANFQLLHGYERILKGLANYNKHENKYRVCIHMVGDGKEKDYYQRMVKDFGLEECVTFYGMLNGSELEKMYSNADIGLGVFGAYKRDIHISSALKTREYLAYGLPVVSGVYEDAFPEKSDFFLELPNDDSDVDINEIVSFFCSLNEKYSVKELRKTIRTYAKETVDVEVTMGPVISYLNS